MTSTSADITRDRDGAATPGPWEVCRQPPNDYWIKDATVFSSSVGKNVAEACLLNSEYEANARLIAAAPEMLAALRDVAEVLGWTIKRDTPEWDGSATPESVLGKARAAIAKAEGREAP